MSLALLIGAICCFAGAVVWAVARAVRSRRWSAALVAGQLLLVVGGGVLLLGGWRSERAPVRTSQELPAARPAHRTVEPRPAPTEVARPAPRRAPAKAEAAGSDGLRRELLANRRALDDIRRMIGSSDADADALRSLVQRQDETIAVQQQALDGAADTERSELRAAIAAAAQTNDVARASLDRYGTTRLALVEREAALKRRNAEIDRRLKQ